VLALLLISLTAWRLARLICKDAFPPVAAGRLRVTQWAGVKSAWHYLVNCIPCASFYTSGATVAAVMVFVGLPVPALYWGAAWGLATFANGVEDLVETLAEKLAGPNG
jgi:hypothetical protein